MVYFVVSDIHSFAKQLKESLRSAGFNKRNKNHTLIVCGDIFDRGSETLDVYKYIMSIPKRRRILVRGNHEDLYEELLSKTFPESHDYSNHTVDTFCHIAGYNPEILSSSYWYKLGEESPYERIHQAWAEIKQLVAEHPITAWLRSDEWLNYYELDKYIFVHSFIPLKNEDGLPGYYVDYRHFSYLKNWRTKATATEWFDSRWGCPWKNYFQGLFEEEEKKGKVLVCGHWVVTDFREHLDCDFSDDTSIYYSDHLIGLDCGVWKYKYSKEYYHPQNVLVIDSKDFNTCYDQNHIKLVYYKAEPHTIIETVSEGDINVNENDL